MSIKIYPQHTRPTSPANIISDAEAKIVASNFETVLPFWIIGNKVNCTLIDLLGNMLRNVSCDKQHNFVCVKNIRKLDLRPPLWINLVSG